MEPGVVLDRPLARGARIPGTSWERGRRAYTAVPLAARVWLVEVSGYQSVVVAGERGALVVDPLSAGRGERLRAAVADLADRPVTDLVYTHHHADHIADAAAVADAGCRIVASAACAAEVARRPLAVPPPTVVVADGGAHVFEDVTLMLHVLPGHCTDNTAVLLPAAGVVQCVDMVHPTQVEFERFGLAEDLVLYERSLRALLALERWDVLVPGHVQVGSREDIRSVLDYLAELRKATLAAVDRHPLSAFVDPALPPTRWSADRQRSVIADVVDAMRPRWGGWDGFDDFAPSHAHAMYWDAGYLTSA